MSRNMWTNGLKAIAVILALALPVQAAQAVTVTQDVSGTVSTMSNTGTTQPWPGFPITFDVTDTFYTQMGVTTFSTTGGDLELSVDGVTGPDGTLDPYVYLFADDGDFSQDDLIAYNDDLDYGVVLDSYLSLSVPAGDYVVLVGQYTNRGRWNGGRNRNDVPSDSSYIDYVTGIVGGHAYQDTESWNTLPQNGTVEASYNYEITLSGEDLIVNGVPAVPLPASMPLLLGAFALPMLLKRRSKIKDAVAA